MKSATKHFKHEERPWGERLEFARNEACSVVMIIVTPGEALSKQYHHNRDEYWYVVEGSGSVLIDDVLYPAKKGDTFFAPKLQNHRIMAGENNSITILEVSEGVYEDEDIVRTEDKYGRGK